MNQSLEETKSQSLTQRLSIEGIELNSLRRYLFAMFVFILCLIVLLWSRLHLNKTRMKLGEAQKTYELALKENQRLELDLIILKKKFPLKI